MAAAITAAPSRITASRAIPSRTATGTSALTPSALASGSAATSSRAAPAITAPTRRSCRPPATSSRTGATPRPAACWTAFRTAQPGGITSPRWRIRALATASGAAGRPPRRSDGAGQHRISGASAQPAKLRPDLPHPDDLRPAGRPDALVLEHDPAEPHLQLLLRRLGWRFWGI